MNSHIHNFQFYRAQLGFTFLYLHNVFYHFKNHHFNSNFLSFSSSQYFFIKEYSFYYDTKLPKEIMHPMGIVTHKCHVLSGQKWSWFFTTSFSPISVNSHDFFGKILEGFLLILLWFWIQSCFSLRVDVTQGSKAKSILLFNP